MTDPFTRKIGALPHRDGRAPARRADRLCPQRERQPIGSLQRQHPRARACAGVEERARRSARDGERGRAGQDHGLLQSDARGHRHRLYQDPEQADLQATVSCYVRRGF